MVIVDTTKGYPVEEASAPGTASTSKYAMANAMLNFLREADDVPFCYLIDLNHDGTEELISVRVFGYEWSVYFIVWKDGRLESKHVDILAGSPCVWLCEDTATGELGIEFRNNDTLDRWSTFYYVTKAEYDAFRAQNRSIKDLEVEDSESADNYRQTTYDQLYKMAGQAPLETDA